MLKNQRRIKVIFIFVGSLGQLLAGATLFVGFTGREPWSLCEFPEYVNVVRLMIVQCGNESYLIHNKTVKTIA